MENKYDEIALIVNEIQQGNDEMFDRLYELTKRMVYFELKSAGVNEADTEDILQETYIKIYNKIHTIEDVQASYKWIKQLAYRTGINYVKSSIVSHEQLSAEGTNDIFESEDSLTNPLPMPEDIMQNKESQRLVREILQELPVLQYKMIVAYYYNESSVKEIAEVFDVPEGTVKTNLFRARAEIKTKVQGLEKKHGIKLYSVAALPLFSFFMDAEVQAAELPAFMKQEGILTRSTSLSAEQAAEATSTVTNAVPIGAEMASGLTVGTGGLSLGVKIVIGVVCSLLAVGGIAVVSNVITDSDDRRNESVVEMEDEITALTEEIEHKAIEEETEEIAEEQKEEPVEEILEEPEDKSVVDSEEVEEDGFSDLQHEGEVLIMSNNFDGTYTMKISSDAYFSKEQVGNTQIGDIITTPMGDQYVLITLQELYEGYYGEGTYLEGFAVRAVGEDVFGFELELSGDRYRLIDPDSGVVMLDGLQQDGVDIKIAENAEIYMFNNYCEPEQTTVEKFVNYNWDLDNYSDPERYPFGRLPMPANARIVNGELVYLSPIWVP